MIGDAKHCQRSGDCRCPTILTSELKDVTPLRLVCGILLTGVIETEEVKIGFIAS